MDDDAEFLRDVEAGQAQFLAPAYHFAASGN